MNGRSLTSRVTLRAARALAACGGLALGAACAPDTVTVRSHPHFVPGAVNTVAIAPFRAFEGTRSGSASSPLRHALVTSVDVPESVPETIRHMVYARLRRNPGVRVVPPDVVERTLRDDGTESRNHQARRLGERLDVDAVMEGLVHVYREREGTTFAATPAAVGFELRLLGARDGAVLWVGEYFEEQKPLTHDVRGFFERSGAFVTAEDLAREGVARVLQRLPLGKE